MFVLADKEARLTFLHGHINLFFLTNQFYVSLEVGFVCEVLEGTFIQPNRIKGPSSSTHLFPCGVLLVYCGVQDTLEKGNGCMKIYIIMM